MFWQGFEKQAMRLGVRAVNPLSSTGKMVGNKPVAGVTTAAAFKPNPLPTAKPMAANKNMAAHISMPTSQTPPAPITNRSKVVAGSSS